MKKIGHEIPEPLLSTIEDIMREAKTLAVETNNPELEWLTVEQIMERAEAKLGTQRFQELMTNIGV